MNTAFNPHRQNYAKYDDNHYLLFLEEKEAEQKDEHGDTLNGYTYTGPRIDGSTLIEATDVTAENMRGKFISGLIRKKYSQDEVEAIILNGTKSFEHAAEMDALQAYRDDCKRKVDELLGRL